MFKKIFSLFLLFFLLINNVQAENTKEEKYSSNIWLSKEIFFQGEKVRIYTKFKNNNNFDIEQTIQFYDNEKLLGEKKVEIAANENLIIWIDRELNSGPHKIISKIKETLKDNLSKKEKINSPKIENLKVINIDVDTDGDGIGDEKDVDDDNDGISDEEEIRKGSDPKSKLSTPKIEETKKVVEEVSQESKTVVQNLLAVFVEKRKSIQEQLKKSLNTKNKNIKKEKEKINIDTSLYLSEKEKKLIEKESKKNNFKKEKNNIKKIFSKETEIKNILKKTEKEILEIDKKNLNTKEKDFSKACLYQAKYEKIKELYKKENSPTSLWNTGIYYFLSFLTFVFQNNFLTVLFLIFSFWIFWKLIKKI